MELTELAKAYDIARNAGNVLAKRRLVAIGLTHQFIDDFIWVNKDGWMGLDGAYARVIARVLDQLD